MLVKNTSVLRGGGGGEDKVDVTGDDGGEVLVGEIRTDKEYAKALARLWEVSGGVLFVKGNVVGSRGLHLDLKHQGWEVEEGETIFQDDDRRVEQEDKFQDCMEDISWIMSDSLGT